jgi:uncharacterized phage protein (TIGR01671 family)
MREILFRGKNNDGKWIEGYYFRYNNIHCIVPGEYSSKSSEYFEVDPETIGQFTDIKDKNGKDIYEGDIISMVDEYYEGDSRYQGFKGQVMYEDGSFGIFGNGQYEYMCLDECCVNNYEYEVIGNIHDNPELLKP